MAEKRGYTNIFSFRDGFPEWVKSGNPVESTSSLPKSPVEQVSVADLKAARSDYYLVDIRDDERDKTGVIPGTDAHMSLFTIHERHVDLPKDRVLILYDTQDRLALNTARYLAAKGFTVKRLQGGIMAWIESGNPVDR